MRVAKVCLIAVVTMGVGAVGVTPPVRAGEPKAGKPRLLTPEQQERIELLKSKGPGASLTILPIPLAGRPFDRVTEVVGLFLEQDGLKNIELGKTVFKPEDRSSMERLAVSLGEFVRRNPITTDYALYAEYNAPPQKRLLDELRAVLVDNTGALVWADRQTPKDSVWKKGFTGTPMGMSILLRERLRPLFSLTEETKRAAKPGKMAAIAAKRSGLPPENERTPLPGRQEEMKKAMPEATLVVFPVRVGMTDDAAEARTAADLAKMINDEGLYKAEAAKQTPLLKASQGDPNEMKILWDLAREFRGYVRKNPTDADYVLKAHYVFNPQRWEQGFVHFVVCDRKGEWVIADLQNSHHQAYRAVKPTSQEDCDRILLERLRWYLK